MTTHSKSRFDTLNDVLYVFEIELMFMASFYFGFRMWREIQRRAKIELLHVLFMIKMITFDASASQERDPDAFYDWKELPDNVSKRWQLLIDIFSKNGFI